MGTTIVFISLLVIWIGFSYIMISPELINLVPILARLTAPSSWDELGNATGILNGDVPTFVEKRVRRAGDGDYAACGLWASAGGREDFRW